MPRDNFTLTLSGFQTRCRLLQWAFHTIETWCGEIGLLVNPNRIELIVFTRKRNLPGFFEPLFFFGVTVQLSMLVKYLGVVLNSWLSWMEPVNIKMKKAHNLFWACRRAYGATWGLKPKVVSWLYVSHHLTIHHLCISSLLTWLSDS